MSSDACDLCGARGVLLHPVGTGWACSRCHTSQPTFAADNPAGECERCGGTRGQHMAATLICPTEWEEPR